ncbi:uncharacterized protein PITG_06527 [Phytophthora infestans T30-4]|uniref:Uncharacterized protein n=1 Tax=Phytophthora infestans (strain T30-4) TaxID=403677 RepID=D0N521_PHYIT|nr:uncharacterized protein PITG_06527 [Phytophthora infestans T30-4]EEY69979.1 conserved hypothetical protein [Phytophthora infestans T30-4]|eukprot:XP_002998626.1 conserved hypothetical protein [Phytophthora infestans T30-4]
MAREAHKQKKSFVRLDTIYGHHRPNTKKPLFKRRRNLVSRRQTTSRSLPANAPPICRDFIQQAQHLIEKHSIQSKNIINMDQVPRYFETEPKSTITSRNSPTKRTTEVGDASSIVRAFALCGLVRKEDFNVKALHPPLRDLLAADVDMDRWNQQYSDLVAADDREQLDIATPTWYLPDDSTSSLFCCLLHGIQTHILDYTAQLTIYMETLKDLERLFDDRYLDRIRNGTEDPGELELYAAAHMHNWDIEKEKTRYQSQHHVSCTQAGLSPR